MNCAESRLLLHAYADDELDVAGSLELGRHLKTCAGCAAEMKALRSIKAALGQPSLRFSAPDSLWRVAQRMARRSRGETRLRLLQSLRLWRALAFGATAFALLAILLRPGMFAREGLLNEAVSSHVRSLMAEHLTDVASGDQHTVKPWFNGKLDFAPEARDFSAQGFPLIGGRLDYLNGRVVAALVYQRNKHFINVFVWPDANAGSGTTALEKRRGYSVINREHKGLRYCLVSDLNDKELGELADLLGR